MFDYGNTILLNTGENILIVKDKQGDNEGVVAVNLTTMQIDSKHQDLQQSWEYYGYKIVNCDDIAIIGLKEVHRVLDATHIFFTFKPDDLNFLQYCMYEVRYNQENDSCIIIDESGAEVPFDVIEKLVWYKLYCVLD